MNSWLQQLSHCLGDDSEELSTALFEWTEGGAPGRDGAPGWRFPATGNGRSEVGACRHQVGMENKEARRGGGRVRKEGGRKSLRDSVSNQIPSPGVNEPNELLRPSFKRQRGRETH